MESIWQRESESTNISEIEKTIYELMVKEDKLMQDNKLLRE